MIGLIILDLKEKILVFEHISIKKKFDFIDFLKQSLYHF